MKPIPNFIGDSLLKQLESIPSNPLSSSMELWETIFCVVDILFIGGIILGVIGLIWTSLKYGFRQIKQNSDETSKDDIIGWKKELKSSFKGFAWIALAPILISSVFSIVMVAIMGAWG